MKTRPACSLPQLALSIGLLSLCLGVCPIRHANADPVGAQSSASQGQLRLRYRVAVDQGKWNEIHNEWWEGLPTEIRLGIQSELIDKLVKSGYFIVMEREAGAMNQMNQEDQIAANKKNSLPSGATPDRQTRTPANFIITPSIIGYKETSAKSGGLNFRGFSVGGGKTEDTLTLNIRISDAQTSEVLDTQTSVGKAKAEGGGVGISTGGVNMNAAQFNSSPSGKAVEQALSDAVDKIISRLSQEPWSASVAAQDKSTNRVIINAGSQAGVQVGQTFDVFRAGTPVTDPDTGDIISKGDETKIGRITIVRVTPTAGFANIISGKGFLPRDIVRTIEN